MAMSNSGSCQLVAQGAASSVFYLSANTGGNIRLQTNGTGATGEQVRITNTTTAVNYVNMTGSATGGTPTISTAGSDADIDLSLAPKGTGGVGIGTSSPTEKLTVAGGVLASYLTANNNLIASDPNGRVSIGIMNAVYNNDNRAFIGWGNTGVAYPSLAGSLILQARSSAASSIIFATGTPTSVERMRIHASGGVSIGNITDAGAGNLSVEGIIKIKVFTVATLPSASTSGIGAKAFVSDALAPAFGSTVVTGGAVAVPVYSDGTNWKVG
jgi:hypothetical protein